MKDGMKKLTQLLDNLVALNPPFPSSQLTYPIKVYNICSLFWMLICHGPFEDPFFYYILKIFLATFCPQSPKQRITMFIYT